MAAEPFEILMLVVRGVPDEIEAWFERRDLLVPPTVLDGDGLAIALVLYRRAGAASHSPRRAERAAGNADQQTSLRPQMIPNVSEEKVGEAGPLLEAHQESEFHDR